MAGVVVPPPRRARGDRNGEVLPTPPQGPSAAGQTQPAPEARVHEHLLPRGAGGAHRARDLQAAPVWLADRAVRWVPGGTLMGLVVRVALGRLHSHTSDP